MNAKMPEDTADELGRRLHAAGFRPLPDVDHDGELIGTRLWRVRAGYVEYLALRPNGFAHAVRAHARFTYRLPADHGPVVEHRSGYAINALDWLLTTNNTPASVRSRPYVAAPKPNQPVWPPDGPDRRY